jgi:hypothetical protein
MRESQFDIDLFPGIFPIAGARAEAVARGG